MLLALHPRLHRFLQERIDKGAHVFADPSLKIMKENRIRTPRPQVIHRLWSTANALLAAIAEGSTPKGGVGQ
jgi:hypothetical protein